RSAIGPARRPQRRQGQSQITVSPTSRGNSGQGRWCTEGEGMTAQFAVMNKGAIALAADSKLTVTTGGVTKTYDTVSKLFTLSEVAPVGVMIYGNADFMGYPWETIIKMYRRAKGAEVEDTVSLWAEDFFRFLDGFG